MFRRSADIFLDALDHSVSSVIREALAEVDKGNTKKSIELLEPLVEEGDAAALFYTSKISLTVEETLYDFEARSFKQLMRSADCGYAPAIHELGVQYDSGEFVSKDAKKAAQFFKRAAEKGHPHSQWIYGLDLLYGSNGIKKDESLGVDYVKKSARANFEGALESMSEFYGRGIYGFPVDENKAQSFKDQMCNRDVLSY